MAAETILWGHEEDETSQACGRLSQWLLEAWEFILALYRSSLEALGRANQEPIVVASCVPMAFLGSLVYLGHLKRLGKSCKIENLSSLSTSGQSGVA